MNKLVTPDLPRLHMVTRSRVFSFPEQELVERVRSISSRTRAIIQLREKHLDASAALRLASTLAETLSGSGSMLVVNERFDIARAAGAAGVHLPEYSCPVRQVKAVSGLLVTGKSVHSLESALMAEEQGADYIVFGPIFETPLKKPFGPPQGLEKLHRVCQSVSIPVYAVGGVDTDTASCCIDAGAYGLAAMSLFYQPDDLGETLDMLTKILNT